MKYLLDSDIVSQLTKPEPNAQVIEWLKQTPKPDTSISVITLMEIQQGIDLLPVGKRRSYFEQWLATSVRTTWYDRLLTVSSQVALHAGSLIAMTKSSGHTADHSDALIAATAHIHKLTLVTLNRKHFSPFGTAMLDF